VKFITKAVYLNLGNLSKKKCPMRFFYTRQNTCGADCSIFIQFKVSAAYKAYFGGGDLGASGVRWRLFIISFLVTLRPQLLEIAKFWTALRMTSLEI
jgi:hypothetical protein